MIEINGLYKRFGDITALDNINLSVEKGQVVGLLGPNGAGKTTLMNIMTGYIAPTSGTALINGIDVQTDPIKAKTRVGYLPEGAPCYPDMLVHEYLRFVCGLKRVKYNEQDGMIEAVSEISGLTGMEKRLAGNLSKGYRQRLGLAGALIGFPDVLILDEPSSGLDPGQAVWLRNVILGLSGDHTIVLSSHLLSDVPMVCDRAVIINGGSVVADGPASMLSGDIRKEERVLIRVKGNRETVLKALDGVAVEDSAVFESGVTDVTVYGNIDARETVFWRCSENRLPIILMKPLGVSLEDVFMEITDRERKQ